MGKPKKDIDRIVNDLLSSAQQRKVVQGREAWNYGWSVEAYRRSAEAAIDTGRELVQIAPEGVESLEKAVKQLVKRPDVSQYWDHEELWGLVAHLVASLPWEEESSLRLEIANRLLQVTSQSPSIVALPLANIAWRTKPLVIADCVIGEIGPEWFETISLQARGRPNIGPQPSSWWLQAPSDSTGSGEQLIEVIGMAAWVPAQGTKALDIAIERFQHLLSLTLILEPDLEGRKLWSGRGESHRPGIRGIALDRHAIHDRLARESEQLSQELAFFTYQVGILGPLEGLRWLGEDPFPLDELLEDSRRKDVESLAIESSSIHARFRTAARWYTKAHWSSTREDEVLNLGIALDALLGEKGGSPGRVLADRFALLEQDRGQRASRAKEFNDFYSARSAVAHGAEIGEVKEPYFGRTMARSVRWVVRELLALMKASNAKTEDDHRRIFDDLKWGIATHRSS
jgi:hypothetical protein